MKNLALFFTLILAFAGNSSSAQKSVTISPLNNSEIKSISSAISLAFEIGKKNKERKGVFDSLRVWLASPLIGTASFRENADKSISPAHCCLNKKASIQILVVEDAAFNIAGKGGGAIFYPALSQGRKYLYLKRSLISKVSAEALALWLIHEMVHMHQYSFLPKKKIYFPNLNDSTPVSREITLLRERGAWKIEASIFLQLHPEYSEFGKQCDCKAKSAEEINKLEKVILMSNLESFGVGQAAEYVYASKCLVKAVDYFYRER